MSDIRSLKCACCKYYDSFDGCTAWGCDFEISIERIKQASQDYGMSISEISALIELGTKGVSR